MRDLTCVFFMYYNSVMPLDPLAARLALAKARQPQHRPSPTCTQCGEPWPYSTPSCDDCRDAQRHDDAASESWVQTEVDALRGQEWS